MKVTQPNSDDEYFERMTHALFQAGLNWKVIQNKWPNFRTAFDDFSINRVARYNNKELKRLMNDQGIIRNEGKIKSTIFNAQQFLKTISEFGSFRDYVNSFGKDHAALQSDLQARFHHLGESSSRTFLWMSGLKLKPTAEEKMWLAQHKK